MEVIGRLIGDLVAGAEAFALRVAVMLFAVVELTSLLASAFFTVGFMVLLVYSRSPLRAVVGCVDLIMATLGSGGMLSLPCHLHTFRSFWREFSIRAHSRGAWNAVIVVPMMPCQRRLARVYVAVIYVK